MIAATHRFKGRKGLAYLHSKGGIVRVQGMSLKFVAGKTSSYRAAVVVSKKVHKSAVVRNRIRRRIYEQIRLGIATNAPYDFAVIVYDALVATMPATDMKKRVAQLFDRAGMPRVK